MAMPHWRGGKLPKKATLGGVWSVAKLLRGRCKETVGKYIMSYLRYLRLGPVCDAGVWLGVEIKSNSRCFGVIEGCAFYLDCV